MGLRQLQVHLDPFGGISILQVNEKDLASYLRQIKPHWLRELLEVKQLNGVYSLLLKFYPVEDTQSFDVVEVKKLRSTIQ